MREPINDLPEEHIIQKKELHTCHMKRKIDWLKAGVWSFILAACMGFWTAVGILAFG